MSRGVRSPNHIGATVLLVACLALFALESGPTATLLSPVLTGFQARMVGRRTSLEVRESASRAWSVASFDDTSASRSVSIVDGEASSKLVGFSYSDSIVGSMASMDALVLASYQQKAGYSWLRFELWNKTTGMRSAYEVARRLWGSEGLGFGPVMELMSTPDSSGTCVVVLEDMNDRGFFPRLIVLNVRNGTIGGDVLVDGMRWGYSYTGAERLRLRSVTVSQGGLCASLLWGAGDKAPCNGPVGSILTIVQIGVPERQPSHIIVSGFSERGSFDAEHVLKVDGSGLSASTDAAGQLVVDSYDEQCTRLLSSRVEIREGHAYLQPR